MANHVVDPELRDLQVRVYMALRQAWNDFGMCPSREQLQHACMCSAPVVHEALKVLKRKGYLVAPKYQVKAIRLTDPERTISNAPLDPWDELAPEKKYFKEVTRGNR